MGAFFFTGSLTGGLSNGLLGHLVRAAALVRAAGMEVAILAGHLVLYPTGVLQECVEFPDHPVPAGCPHPPAVSPDIPAVSPDIPAMGPGIVEYGRRGDHPVQGGAAALVQRGAAPSAGSHPPVLLLHGFVDNRSVFALLRRSLRRHGWDHVQALNYSPLTCDIRHAATLLGHHVERLCEQTGHPHVDIVGHSMGGLIARYYVQQLGGHPRVRTLVTLGTPHSGTRAVPFANTHPIVRQMRPDSELMTELAQPAVGCGTRFIAFWSDLDQFMIPTETARLDHPDLVATNVQVHGIGHLAMPVNGAVAAGIREALQRAEQAAGAADAA